MNGITFRFMQTPCFIFEKKILEDELESLGAAIDSCWKNTAVAYSVKTNSLPYLAKYLNGKGLYAEVVSEDEYSTVSACGYSPSHIVCNGPIKSRDFISKLLSEGAIVNIDSHAELDSVREFALKCGGRAVEVGLRVNIDIETYFPEESKSGPQGSRFGFCTENTEFASALKILEEIPGIKITGLHLHVSTITRRVEIYRWLTRKFVSLVKEYRLDDIRYFDIGGGFFGGLPDKPGWNDYLKAIGEELSAGGFSPENLKLIIEPGVSLLAGAFSYCMRVADVKDTARSRFVVMDGSRIHIDPFFHKTGYVYGTSDLRGRTCVETQRLVGFTCLEYDNIMTLDRCSELKPGDMVTCSKVGAYTMSLSPLFISYFPPVYMREYDGSLSLVRRKWTTAEFIQSSILD